MRAAKKRGWAEKGEGTDDFPFINNRQFNFNELILTPYPSLLVFITSISIL